MHQEIAEFPFAYEQRDSALYIELVDAVDVADVLMEDYRRRSVLKSYSGGRITLQEFYPRRSKPLIDRIDDLLGQVYGLTAEEVDYIKRYDAEFRLNEQ